MIGFVLKVRFVMELELVSDEVLVEALKEGFRGERREQVLFLKRLAEVDRRGLWKKTARSLNEFCCRAIGLSESSAWKRIQVCHLATRIPYVWELLENNRITLTNLSILSPCLTVGNASEVLEEASGQGRYAVEAIRARSLPKPEPKDTITPLSQRKTSPAKGTTTRVRISYVADESLVREMERVKSLVAHKFPNARLEEIEHEVYRFYLEAHDWEKKELRPGRTVRPQSRPTRYIPVEIRKAVWRRDESRCTHRYENGERCTSTHGLEIDHIQLFSQGGRSDLLENLRLLCFQHNQQAAERALGKRFMEQFRTPPSVRHARNEI
jgi:HNH endonuclease